MNSTNIHTLIMRKFDILNSILTDESYISRIHNLPENNNRMNLIDKLNIIQINYQLGRLAIDDLDYNMYIVRDNIIEKIDECSNECNKLSLSDIQKILMSNYKSISPCIDRIALTNFTVCSDAECRGEMKPVNSGAELCCCECGLMVTLKGTHHEAVGESCIKPNPYQPSQHYVKWLTKIFGQEKTIIPNELIDKLVECAARDSVKMRNITCSVLRTYLKCIYINGESATKYNSNVVKIRGKMTGEYPPQPTADEFHRMCYLFDVADDIYVNQIRESSASSRKYYPFFASRTISIVYASKPKKRDKIIMNIHIQEAHTDNKHKALWSRIVNLSNGILF